MAETTVSETTYEDENGTEQTQFRTTVPKDLAEAFDMGGETIEWEVVSGNALRVTIVDDG